MIQRNEFLFLVVAMTVALALVGTSGVSSMAGDRSAAVSFVDDDEAALGIEQTTETENETTIRITNQFAESIILETVTVNGEEITDEPLVPGDSVSIEVNCNEEVEIVVAGSEVKVSLTRTIEC